MLRFTLRAVVPLVLGSCLGFLALGFATANEPSIPGPLLALIAPGLQIAELTMPQQHVSLGSEFGSFLRIAIGMNAVYYFVVFATAAYFIDRRSKP
jgi:hypothetical protein